MDARTHRRTTQAAMRWAKPLKSAGGRLALHLHPIPRRRSTSMSTLLADLRYALRQLRRGPAFAATAILTLALGVAANVIVFGVIDGLFLRPSSIPKASQLSFIQHRDDNDVTMSFPNYRD